MKIKVVIAGYYFGYEFYRKVSEISHLYENVGIVIVSHKSVSEIPQDTMFLIKTHGLELREEINEGWDWGAFCQFSSEVDSKNIEFEYALFMHDDIYIKDISFIDKLISLANEGYVAVGNSKPKSIIENYDKKYTNEYLELLSKGFTPANSFPVFRGSFVFMSKTLVLDVLANYEYKKLGPIENANISLRQVASLFGLNVRDSHLYCYLGENYLDSDFIAEFQRGEKQGPKQKFVSKLTFIFSAIKRFVRVLLEKIGLFAEQPNNNSSNDLFINISDTYYLNGFINISNKDGFDLQSLDLIKLSSLANPRIYVYLDFNLKNFLPIIKENLGECNVYLYSGNIEYFLPTKLKRKKSLGRLFKNKIIFKT